MEIVITEVQARRSDVHGATPYECESTAPSLSGIVTVARVYGASDSAVASQAPGPRAISVPSYGVFR